MTVMREVAPKASADVGGWLRGLGLAQYETVFRENGIDFELLPKLTVEDLKELGVGAVGHRRKLFELDCGTAPRIRSGGFELAIVADLRRSRRGATSANGSRL